jgi:hypothetical protein
MVRSSTSTNRENSTCNLVVAEARSSLPWYISTAQHSDIWSAAKSTHFRRAADPFLCIRHHRRVLRSHHNSQTRTHSHSTFRFPPRKRRLESARTCSVSAPYSVSVSADFKEAAPCSVSAERVSLPCASQRGSAERRARGGRRCASSWSASAAHCLR